MSSVCLVACTSRKGLYPAPAEFIYRSPLFTAARNYAETRCDQWLILSAKYGLLTPTEVIKPYDQSLLDASDQERRAWAHKVLEQLNQRIDKKADIVFLAGGAYRSYLQPLLEQAGHRTAMPMSALGIGSQVAWLQKIQGSKTRLQQLDRFYKLLGRLSKLRTDSSSLRNQSAQSVRPTRGVYFFFEPGEFRMTDPFVPRVTRIGTHSVSLGSKSTLWNRLRTHRGAGDGSGNHRGSIFRLHVGESLLRRSELNSCFSTWGIGQSATADVRAGETEIELEVSSIIGAMSVVWLEVGDEASADSDRTYLERNLIALVAGANGPLDLPTAHWLGRWSSRAAIRSSGMWNVNHVHDNFDPHALNVLEWYVEIAEGKRPPAHDSLAPSGWRKAITRLERPTQIELLQEDDSNE